MDGCQVIKQRILMSQSCRIVTNVVPGQLPSLTVGHRQCRFCVVRELDLGSPRFSAFDHCPLAPPILLLLLLLLFVCSPNPTLLTTIIAIITPSTTAFVIQQLRQPSFPCFFLSHFLGLSQSIVINMIIIHSCNQNGLQLSGGNN